MGERALLAEVDALGDVLLLHRRLAASVVEGVVDLVPAARTVLVTVDPQVLPLAAARAWIVRAAETDAAEAVATDAAEVVLDVVYDGPDLAGTAELLGISADELVRRHCAARWRVAFTGFAPGFGYLVSDDWPFDVPRLDTPRTRVPAGAVGLAAAFTGAYPRETPGGWRLIGTTAAPLWDPDASAPALLTPGAAVRFLPHAPTEPGFGARGRGDASPLEARGRGGSTSRTRARDAAEAPDTARGGVRIVEPGLLTTVQDLGRPGHAAQGIARSGALDRGALRTANRLVGNREDAAALEVTMGGLRAVAEQDAWVAVTGAWGRLVLDGAEVDPYAAHPWPAGAELLVDWFAHGARGYVAVRGGLDTPRAVGSRASDLMAGLGLGPLRGGDVLPVGDHPAAPIPVQGIAPWGAPHDEELEIELAPGSRADRFAAGALTILFEGPWTVTNDADRVGMRLDGPVLERIDRAELASEGMVPGALQVPPSGRPTILLADGPVTGGYPVIAVATDAALDLLAQARPGTRIRFRHARPQ
jgi:KipI family sensor histidine kinase inhibitor